MDSVVGWAEVAGAADSPFLFKSMTVDSKVRCLAKIASVNEVIMKIAATTTVSLLRKLAGPRLPNTVWLDPPNEAPISAPLPDWRRMAPIMRTQMKTWMMTIKVYIWLASGSNQLSNGGDCNKRFSLETSPAD